MPKRKGRVATTLVDSNSQSLLPGTVLEELLSGAGCLFVAYINGRRRGTREESRK